MPVLPDVNPSSLSGNAADYQSGGKKKSMKKKSLKKKSMKKKLMKKRSTKKTCWWKFW